MSNGLFVVFVGVLSTIAVQSNKRADMTNPALQYPASIACAHSKFQLSIVLVGER